MKNEMTDYEKRMAEFLRQAREGGARVRIPPSPQAQPSGTTAQKNTNSPVAPGIDAPASEKKGRDVQCPPAVDPWALQVGDRVEVKPDGGYESLPLADPSVRLWVPLSIATMAGGRFRCADDVTGLTRAYRFADEGKTWRRVAPTLGSYVEVLPWDEDDEHAWRRVPVASTYWHRDGYWCVRWRREDGDAAQALAEGGTGAAADARRGLSDRWRPLPRDRKTITSPPSCRSEVR